MTENTEIDLTNPYYKSEEFKEKYKFALFLILAEHYKEYIQNNKTLPTPLPEGIIKVEDLPPRIKKKIPKHARMVFTKDAFE